MGRMAGIRDAIDWIENQRILDEHWWRLEVASTFRPQLNIPVNTREELRHIMHELGGSWVKDFSLAYATVSREEGALEIMISIVRDKVCQAVVVGEREVEIVDLEAPKIRQMQPVIEWQCSPLLGES